jgi:hypothetical protein
MMAPFLSRAKSTQHTSSGYALVPCSRNCVQEGFSEDEMRRPTPYAVPYGLQTLYGLSNAQEGGSAHHGW